MQGRASNFDEMGLEGRVGWGDVNIDEKKLVFFGIFSSLIMYTPHDFSSGVKEVGLWG